MLGAGPGDADAGGTMRGRRPIGSSVDSWELSQAGNPQQRVYGGKPAKLAPMASERGFEPDDPAAVAVLNALDADGSSIYAVPVGPREKRRRHSGRKRHDGGPEDSRFADCPRRSGREVCRRPNAGNAMTEVISIDPQRPEPNILAHAGDILRQGGLVAYPTETVYGLAASAFADISVARVFDAKGRPSGQPLPVQIADAGELETLARDIPEAAKRLLADFFPGPLTLIFWRQPTRFLAYYRRGRDCRPANARSTPSPSASCGPSALPSSARRRTRQAAVRRCPLPTFWKI